MTTSTTVAVVAALDRSRQEKNNFGHAAAHVSGLVKGIKNNAASCIGVECL